MNETSETVVVTCPKCGSPDVTKDAIARWDFETNMWSLASVFDRMTCGSCHYESDVFTDTPLPALTEEQKYYINGEVTEYTKPKVEYVKYSAEWIKALAIERGATQLIHHKCATCYKNVRYSIVNLESNILTFDAECLYGGREHGPRRASSWEDIAEWLAMHSSDEMRDKTLEGLIP